MSVNVDVQEEMIVVEIVVLVVVVIVLVLLVVVFVIVDVDVLVSFGCCVEDSNGVWVLKVEQEKVDCFMNLIGEMVVVCNGLFYLVFCVENQYGECELGCDIWVQYVVINCIVEEMQDVIMQVCMMLVFFVFQCFLCLVCDIVCKLGKEV